MNQLVFLHWNIKELDAEKVRNQSLQFQAASAVIRDIQPNVLSLNELGYGTHEHSDTFTNILRASVSDADSWQQTFFAANSGQRARPDLNGKYLSHLEELTPDQRNTHLDQSNFGLFPGQFSVALGSRLPVHHRHLIRDLTWKAWDPEAPLQQMDLGGMTAEQFPLFDKSFQVTWCRWQGRDFAIISLHCVPAFDFGQPRSPNVLRNAAQLEFLAWYLTGKHPRYKPVPSGIEPLPADLPFIAVGDFNIALDSPHPGARALAAILKHPRVGKDISHIPSEKLGSVPGLQQHHTFFSSGWDTQRGANQLDYFFVSQEFMISRLETLFINPELQDHGLFISMAEAEKHANRLASDPSRTTLIVPRKGLQAQPIYLLRSASAGFARLRTASDHLPLLLECSWKS